LADCASDICESFWVGDSLTLECMMGENDDVDVKSSDRKGCGSFDFLCVVCKWISKYCSTVVSGSRAIA